MFIRFYSINVGGPGLSEEATILALIILCILFNATLRFLLLLTPSAELFAVVLILD